MSDVDARDAASVETSAEFKKSPAEFTKHWLKAIDLAGEEEKPWRTDAEDTIKRYKSGTPKSFNILYANTQTTVPALYNSEPSPDIRRRFGDNDPVGETFSQMLERNITIFSELYDFDGVMKAAVRDRQLAGRGVARIRVSVGDNGSKSVKCETVLWDHYRRGPAKKWEDVPWDAFLHNMTREELVALSPKIGPKVKLNVTLSDDKDSDKTPDMFKRATVWEVWDKAERKVYFFAESYTDGPVAVLDDPYELRDFRPLPRPLYQVELTDTLVPVCEFTIWKALADEVDEITKRISNIIKVMKMRGLYDGAFANIVERLKNLDDGELGEAEDATRAMQQGGIDKAIWMWPVDIAIQVVQGLYEAREQAKGHLYELTGVADILRGQTEPQETLGAQQIKAQWGSLRLQEGQRDIQRFARDLYRLMADAMGQVFSLPELLAMASMNMQPPKPPQIPPDAPPEAQQQAMAAFAKATQDHQALMQGMEALLKTDLQREFQIEIETDSTIRADLTRAQQNIAGFGEMFGAFIERVGPAVQAGMMPAPLAVQLLMAFARNFKLGREAEQVLDEWVKFLEQQAGQPKQPSPEEQKAQMEMQVMQAKAQAEQQQRAQELQAKEQENAMDLQMKRAELQLKAQELELKQREIMMKANAATQEHQFHMQAAQEEAEFASRERQANAEHEDTRRAAEIDFMKQKNAMKPNGEARQ